MPSNVSRDCKDTVGATVISMEAAGEVWSPAVKSRILEIALDANPSVT